jgi:hypothetical protein
MTIGYCYPLFDFVIDYCYGYWLLLIAIDYYCGFWTLVLVNGFFLAIDSFEFHLLKLGFGFSKVKY